MANETVVEEDDFEEDAAKEMATDITEHVPEAAEQSGVTKVIVT